MHEHSAVTTTEPTAWTYLGVWLIILGISFFSWYYTVRLGEYLFGVLS